MRMASWQEEESWSWLMDLPEKDGSNMDIFMDLQGEEEESFNMFILKSYLINFV